MYFLGVWSFRGGFFFFAAFSWKFRVWPSWVSLAGRGILYIRRSFGVRFREHSREHPHSRYVTGLFQRGFCNLASPGGGGGVERGVGEGLGKGLGRGLGRGWGRVREGFASCTSGNWNALRGKWTSL